VQIQCPKRLNQNYCEWTNRDGSVRDYPKVGLKECLSCGLVTHKKDLSEEVNYQKGTMHRWAAGYGSAESISEPDGIRRMQAISILRTRFNLNTILDFGSGNGSMLLRLREKFKVFGLEPDELARKKTNDLGIKVFEDVNEILAEEILFDAITMFHVVEHLYEPINELNRLKKILKPNGILIIETPNANDALLTKYNNLDFSNFTYWSHHPMIHSNNSLKYLAESAGYEVALNSGVQRYDLNNTVYWLSHGKPGGHDTWKNFISSETSEKYANNLISMGLSDTIWLIAKNSNV
jgi:2-polyprenyl-3-methyl-5-hydroxy-6-metoxy-1,4-benzoquinol methylase